MITNVEEVLRALPSAQPEKRTETLACDLISRQAADGKGKRWVTG